MYICLLQGCIQRNALLEGKVIHAHIKQSGFMEDTLLHNKLLNVYAKCDTMVDALKVFDQMLEQNVCSWTVMIAASARDGLPEEALALFHRMSRTGLQPNHFTFVTVLPACANLASLWKGVDIHTKIIKSGCESDLVVANALIDMNANYGSIENAHELFDKMLQRDVVSWTTLIAACAHNGLLDAAKSSFENLDSTFGVFEKESLQKIMGFYYRSIIRSILLFMLDIDAIPWPDWVLLLTLLSTKLLFPTLVGIGKTLSRRLHVGYARRVSTPQ